MCEEEEEREKKIEIHSPAGEGARGEGTERRKQLEANGPTDGPALLEVFLYTNDLTNGVNLISARGERDRSSRSTLSSFWSG